jgi:hypothetical protein
MTCGADNITMGIRIMEPGVGLEFEKNILYGIKKTFISKVQCDLIN